MAQTKTAYELGQSQVATPNWVVDLLWRLTHERRPSVGRVLDLGAGDGRFARGGAYGRYVGIEIDPAKSRKAALPRNGSIERGCAFEHNLSGYDACIGNPPYVRHNDLESPWRDRTANQLEADLGISLNRKANLYLYFLCLGLLKSHASGIVAVVIPYEWVSRPSASSIRRLIQHHRWDVSVYRFTCPIFPGVLTTASISIVDKRSRSGQWRYFDVDRAALPTPRRAVVSHPGGLLEYGSRGSLWAMRGLSPGGQDVFCLTEGERVHHGLRYADVTPCVTTLRHVPPAVRTLTPRAFHQHFVEAGARCWLVNSDRSRLSKRVERYLAGVPEADRDNYTCNNRSPWYAYKRHPTGGLLIASGFMGLGPKCVVNQVNAQAVGSVTAIYGADRVSWRRVQAHLSRIDFSRRVVPHAKTLRKVEVRQLNAALTEMRYGD